MDRSASGPYRPQAKSLPTIRRIFDMQTRYWLTGAAAVAVVAAGVYVASPTVHGQTPPGAPRAETTPEAATLAADINQAVRAALDAAGLRNGELGADVRRTIEEATRTAQEAVKHVDVEVMVDDAMQDLPDMAMLAGRPRIGVSTRDVTAEEAKSAGLSGITGAYVIEVPADSAAGKAGIQAKDIIVSVDGETIRSARQLTRVIGESPDGRALQIVYVRGSAKNTASVTPEVRAPRAMTWERRPGPRGGPMGGPDGEGPVVRRFERRVVPGGPVGPGEVEREFDVVIPREGPGPGAGGQQFFFRQGPGGNMRVWTGRGRLGVMAQPLTEQLAAFFGVKDGVLVTQVTEASAAAKAGIKAGDVITAVNGKPVKDAGDILDHLQGVENGKTVPVELTRDKKSQTVTVTLEAPSNTSGDRPATRRQRFTA
jgi:membrane-associated protease RseP (regulator of RpoE activity)